MKDHLHKFISSDMPLPTRQLAADLRRSLNANYGRIFGQAGAQWERRFAGREPSDACVRVRISGTARPSLERVEFARQPYASLAA